MKKLLVARPASRNPRLRLRSMAHIGIALGQAVFLGLVSIEAGAQENELMVDDQGVQVLTRGPVHEAFAGIVSYNPEPGVMVNMAPPVAIEELPPAERPEGDNINWIPGYWAWDDEGSDYLWVSGTWRALPPGRQWTIGYWGQAGQGYQWTSGYWADSSARETTYLPRPPATVEVGPNVAAPSRDHIWSPGSWAWQQERYAWSPGYWAEGRTDWDWTPSHYVWTPRGHVYVDGFWDYSMNRRGVVYAPVHFQAGYRSRPGYQYSPVVAIGLVAMMDHLFLRPKYNHYYFGDYYDRRYGDNGYFSPHAFQSNRHGYDPVYSYQRWSHRQDNDWERRHLASYDYRRDHESARPPRTWNDQRRLNMDKIDEKDRRHYRMAAPFDEMAKNPDNKMRVQSVSANERQKLADQGREVRKNRDQRRVLEAEGAKASNDKSVRDFKPTKVKREASPLAGKSRDQLTGDQAPPKPHRDRNDSKKEQADERKPGSDKARPDAKDSKNEQPSSRREEDTKAKEAQGKPNPADRPQGKPEEKAPRRDTGKQPDRKPNPDKVDRPETGKEHTPPRPRSEPTSKEPDRKKKQETNQKENDSSTKPREQGKPKQSESQDRKPAKPSSGKKSDADKNDSGLSDEDARKKE